VRQIVMLKKYLLNIVMGMISTGLFSQVVVSDPELPLENLPVTIYFDATQGTGGLEDYSGEVYAHTGVLTNESSGNSDWKYVKTDWGENTSDTKLTKVEGEDNLYRLDITPSIREYYGVPAEVQITHMAFVFRSDEPYTGTTYYEGKGTGGADIFVEVFQEGLNISITNPAETLLEETNTDITFSASSTLPADITLLLNGTEVKSETGEELTHTFNFSESGDYWAKVTASDDSETVQDSVFIHILGTQTTSTLPAGSEAGINYVDENTVNLVLYAPDKEHVFVIGDFNFFTPSSNYRMNLDGEYYWLTLDNIEPGKEYAFQYFIDGEIRIADPYTEKILDQFNDRWIDESTYPDLKEYPYGLTDRIVSVFQTNQTEYEWQHEFDPPAKENLVIYEMLVRDFIEAHDWKTLTDTLDYFSRLGINALEIMPFNEFEGNESWGYNPSFYFAPDKYYGPKEDLKAFIDSCHARGIAVIMDMVLNHSFGQSPLVRMYWNDALGQPAANNPWYNETSPNQVFSWGYDFDHESQATKDFVDRVNRFWLEEYNLDGFRFDFTKGFTNTPGDGGNYDAARIAILKRMADQIWTVNQDAYVILEHFAPNTEEKELAEYGMMIWGNMNYNYSEAAMGYNESGKSNFSRVSHKQRLWDVPHLVGYMESHDEERLMYKTLTFGNSLGEYDTRDFTTAYFRQELVAAFFFTIPGPKMIWQFGEMAYDYSIDFNGRVGNKPIRWDYYTSRKRLRAIYSTLINLKLTEPAFSTSDFNLDVAGPMKRIELNHEDMDVRIIGNFDLQAGEKEAAFSRTGSWYEYLSGEELNVTDVNMSFNLEPGEYRIFTTKQLTTPELPTHYDYRKFSASLDIFPNPVIDELRIRSDNIVKETTIRDMAGRLVLKEFPGSNEFSLQLSGLKPGVYIIENIESSGKRAIERIIKK